MRFFLSFIMFNFFLLSQAVAGEESSEKSAENTQGEKKSKNNLEKTAESFLGKMVGGLGEGEEGQEKGKHEDLLGDFKNKDGSKKHNLLGGVNSLMKGDNPDFKGILEVLKPKKEKDEKKHYSFEETSDSSSSPPTEKHHKKKHKKNLEDESITEGVKKNN